MTASRPLLSVVICTRNRAGLLLDTLDSLAAQTLDRSAFELLVVDDGSTDETRSAVGSFTALPGIRYAYQRQAGLASGKNHGLFLARGSLVLFQDDDDLATPTLLEEHVRAHEANPEESVAVLGYTRLHPSMADDPLMRFVTEKQYVVMCCYWYQYRIASSQSTPASMPSPTASRSSRTLG